MSVQQVLEDCMCCMTSQNRAIIGCGRTDAGVHARQYFAHMDHPGFDFDPVDRLNRMLPDDVTVFEFIPLHDRAHSRFDAIQRTYQYHIHLSRDPFLAPYSTYMEWASPDFGLLDRGLEFLLGLEDFRHVCLTPDRTNNTICPLNSADFTVSTDGRRVVFTFSAARFLKSMIRIMVARLIELAMGKISLSQFEDINTGNARLKYSTIAYPQGLHLVSVQYPYLDCPLISGVGQF